MKNYIRSFQVAFLLFIMLLSSCGRKEPIDAAFLLKKVNESHQTSNLLGKKIAFTFREYQYSLERTKDHYIYTRTKDSIQDVLFQDYINYKPSSLSVSLDSLPKLFETQQLQKVSEIINTNIEVY